ncbi:exported zinc metalloprotease YfgC [Klebsiella variicola]|uniref:Exported zinc metalloprotease YfgC n=1 Tax=Klebsiella variicola TaxID=244366 RepID=A0A7H4MQ74_KLEVA|nr:exported zinc metalloprotease YfgC [Klebsiella variicola]
MNRYTFTNKEDGNGWDLLAQAEGALGNRDQELAARAESMALVGQLEQAISLLSSASSQVKLGSLQQARYDAPYRPATRSAGPASAPIKKCKETP